MQRRCPPYSGFLAITLVAGVAAMGSSGAQPVRSAPVDSEARDIIDRALERSAWAEEEGFETRYRRTMRQWIRLYDDQGNVTDDETRGYEVEPHRGALFHKLTTRNGQPLKRLDQIEQKERWEEFQAQADDPWRGRREDADDNEIKFDRELVGRYTITLKGVRQLRSRPSYVLSFEPRPGTLPVRRRIDHALNESRGEIWIDQEIHEVARVSFQMMESVSIWWGILGTISDATGRLEREPVAGDVWLNTELEVYFHARVVFRTTRRNQTTWWSEFELAE